MDKQRAIQESVDGINLSTQGLGEKFLGFIQDSSKWKAELIHAIHQERAPPGDSARSDHAHISERHGRLRRTLLESLHFAGMTDRHHRIVEAHEKTFQWLFLPDNANQQKWTDFSEWLEGESTLYWITGKAGSGKSTLMKYIYGDKRTMDHLKTWAAGVPLVTAAFFFWNSSTRMQMSEVGFLQSILSQVLTERPTLIPRILPERWEIYDLFGHDESIWSEPELQRAFRLLAREETPEAKFCFFIDGLDEFDGEHTNLIRLIKDISPSSNIKLCVSSRPWVLFEDAFKHKPSLMLQDLTYPDIRHFIDSAFNNKPEFVELEKREPRYASELLKDIAQKSSGVFLWVNLVVHSLLAGLVNGDRVSDLQRRLDLLPPDLEHLYEKMLNSLDPFYLEHASQIFQHVQVANEPPSLFCLSFADEEPEFVFRMEVRPLPEDEEFSRADIMRRRLNSRCKGLLEVVPAVLLPTGTVDFGEISLVERSTTSYGFLSKGTFVAEATVQYLHRTVKDFLETPKVWDRIMLACPRTYDPYLAMCRSFVSQLKCMDPGSTGTEAFQRTVRRVMLYAHSVQNRLEEGQSTQSLISLMDEFDRTATNLYKASGMEHSWPSKFLSDLLSRKNQAITSRLTFLSLAVRLGLHAYVEAKVHHGCLAHDNDGIMPLLSDAIKPRIGFCNHPITRSQSVKMVKMLLEHGADPNKVCLTKQQCTITTPSFQRTNTMWHELLQRPQLVEWGIEYIICWVCCSHGYTHSVDEPLPHIPDAADTFNDWTELVYWFLVYGADATVDLGSYLRRQLMDLPKDKLDRVLAIMKAGRRQTWFRKKNPNLTASGNFKVKPRSDMGVVSLPVRQNRWKDRIISKK